MASAVADDNRELSLMDELFFKAETAQSAFAGIPVTTTDAAATTTTTMPEPTTDLLLDGPFGDPMNALLLDDDVGSMGDVDMLMMHCSGYDDEQLQAGAYSPTTTDDLTDDTLTDIGSEMSSPPPPSSPITCEDSAFASKGASPMSPPPVSPATSICSSSRSNSGSAGYMPTSPPAASTTGLSVSLKTSPTSPPTPVSVASTPAMPPLPPLPLLANAMLPFAFPVAACLPAPSAVTALNSNHKRPLPEVAPTPASIPLPPAPTPVSALDTAMSKKSKREIRQMKNRESANRSRLRRKAQLTDLADEVEILTKQQQELQNTIAALRAENKSLHDQNAFLRSLVTMYSDPHRSIALPPVPQELTHGSVSLSDLENGRSSDGRSAHTDEDDEGKSTIQGPKKLRKSTTTAAAKFSAASLGVCASVFGLTILTDLDNGATTNAATSTIRRGGRVLHSLPSTVPPSCSPTGAFSMLEKAWDAVVTRWAYVTSSDLAYGIALNVLSFVIIMGLYHLYQQHFRWSSSPRRGGGAPGRGGFRWRPSVEDTKASSRRQASPRTSKRRSVSWQDVRLRDPPAGLSASSVALPRVERTS